MENGAINQGENLCKKMSNLEHGQSRPIVSLTQVNSTINEPTAITNDPIAITRTRKDRRLGQRLIHVGDDTVSS
jgi:hypothetical protein